MSTTVGQLTMQFDKLLSDIEATESGIIGKLEEGVAKITAHAAERAVANAPILEGPLRANIFATPVQRSGNEIRGQVVATQPYALKQHEELTPAGALQLGPISAQQPGTPEGGVGGKYIERVVKHHSPRYLAFMKNLLSDDSGSVAISSS